MLVFSYSLDHVTHLQEPGDVPLVIDAHGNHVLKHPEERTVLSFFGLGLAQQTVKLEEQPPCAFWSNKTQSPEKLLQCLWTIWICPDETESVNSSHFKNEIFHSQSSV